MSLNLALDAQKPDTKLCRVCKQHLSLDSFKHNSRQCKKCIYNKNKTFFKEYYQEKREDINERVKEIYHIRTKDIPKKQRGRKRIPDDKLIKADDTDEEEFELTLVNECEVETEEEALKVALAIEKIIDLKHEYENKLRIMNECLEEFTDMETIDTVTTLLHKLYSA